MRAILDIVIYALNLYKLVIVAGAVLSWLIAFGVVNIRNDFVRAIWNLFLALTEPLLASDPQFSAEYRRHRHFADHLAVSGDAG